MKQLQSRAFFERASRQVPPPVRKFFLFSSLLIAALSFSSCGSGRSGIVLDDSGKPVPESAVKLITIDDGGVQTNKLDVAVTDKDGRFHFDTSSETNGSVVATAAVGSGNLRGFWAGSDDSLTVSPLTDGLVQLILNITETSGDPSVTDFSTDELRGLETALLNADSSKIDLSDSSEIQDFIKKTIGRQIALAAGGKISAESSISFEKNENSSTISFAPNAICGIGYNIHVFVSSKFKFGLRPDGTLCGNTDGGPTMLDPVSMQLVLPDEQFFFGGFAFPVDESSARFEGKREVKMGPQTILVPGNPGAEDTFEISRKVFIPSSGDVVRYLEIFSNTGPSERTISFEVKSTLLSSNASAVLTHDISTAVLGTTDRFLAAYDTAQNRPTVGYVYQDGLGTDPVTALDAPGIAGSGVNDVIYKWTMTVPALKTKTFLHYVYVTSSRDPENVHATLENLAEEPDMKHLSLAELSTLSNFVPTEGTIRGEAGSVIGEALVTAKNRRTGITLSNKARLDGSFAIPLETKSKDLVTIIASDGLITELRVP